MFSVSLTRRQIHKILIYINSGVWKILIIFKYVYEVLPVLYMCKDLILAKHLFYIKFVIFCANILSCVLYCHIAFMNFFNFIDFFRVL